MTGPEADRETDRLYTPLRRRFGARSARANGYLDEAFFERERTVVLSRLDPRAGPILDIACGSGLFVEALRDAGADVLGVDFNEIACRDARAQGLPVVRGDATRLPFADASFQQALCCQFLNQQLEAVAERFLAEASRVLRRGGRLLVLWRHGRSLAHRAAHAVAIARTAWSRGPSFPQRIHTTPRIIQLAREHELVVVERGVTLPFGRKATASDRGPRAALLGSSRLLVLEKHDASIAKGSD